MHFIVLKSQSDKKSAVFWSILSPGIIIGIPGGHGQAVSAAILPTAFRTATVSNGANIAFLGLRIWGGQGNFRGRNFVCFLDCPFGK